MKFRVGVMAMAASVVPYLALAAVPFLGISFAKIASAVAIALIVAEVIFWSGLVLAGTDARKALRSHGLFGAPRELWRMLRSGRATVDQASETKSA